jgi:hypothetical protein
MSSPPAEDPFPRVVKPLLVEALGQNLLCYVLGISEQRLTEWLAGDDDELGDPAQDDALKQLHVVLHVSGSHDEPYWRRRNLERILGVYDDREGTTVVNVIRGIATGQSVDQGNWDSPRSALAALVRDLHALHLLPSDSMWWQDMSLLAIHFHPGLERFASLAVQDKVFGALFPGDDEDALARGAYVERSSGHESSLDLRGLPGLLIANGWRAARAASPSEPTLDEHVAATLTQFDRVRQALAGKAVEIPIRVAFTGLLLDSDPIDLGWGTLRAADARDSALAPPDLRHKLSGTAPDGEQIEIDFSGNVILEATIPYRARATSMDFLKEPSAEMREWERIKRLVECAVLGALLSQETTLDTPITLYSTWQYVDDPLTSGPSTSWSDPRSKSISLRRVSAEAAVKWGEMAVAIEKARTKHIDVAIRRTLRASVERTDLADVLVDSIIAWENLFGSRKGEPTLRVTGSIAWLLEQDREKRATLRSELAKLYDIRSDVVHGNKDHEPRDLGPKARRALEVAVDCLRVLFTTRPEMLSEFKTGDERSNHLLMGG